MTPIAVELCNKNELLFDEVFRYQYVISSAPMDLPGFVTHRLDDLVLQTGSAMRCLGLQDSHGRHFGFVFGVSAPHDGRTTVEFLTEDFDSLANDAARVFEERLTHLSGRYGVIVAFDSAHRFYTDASGMIGANYNATKKTVAASVNLCISAEAAPGGFAMAKPGVFALDYTSDHAVSRLNSNHYLDLHTFETKRFWPREDHIFQLAPPAYAGALDEIIAATRRIVARLVAENSVALPVSGGYDSRSIVALTEDQTMHDMHQIYTHVTTKINIADVSIANQICDIKSLGLEVHNTLRNRRFPSIETVEVVEARYRIASGGAMQPHNFLLNGTYSRVKRDAVVLRGQQIPILRGLFVNNADSRYWSADRISEHFLGLLKSNDIKDDDLRSDFAHRVTVLYDELPANARCRALDLLLVEGVNGPDLASWMCAVSHNFYLSPYNSRRMIQLFSSFGTRFRRIGYAMNLLLMRADPALLGVALLHSVKRVDSSESNESMQQRQELLDGLRRTYEQIFRDKPEPIELVRFRTNGIA